MDAVFEVKPELNAEVSARQFDKAERIGWLDQHRRRSPVTYAGGRYTHPNREENRSPSAFRPTTVGG